MDFVLAIVLTVAVILGCGYIIYLATRNKKKDNFVTDLPEPTGTEAATGMYKTGMRPPFPSEINPVYRRQETFLPRTSTPEIVTDYRSRPIVREVIVERDNSDALLTGVLIGEMLSSHDSPSYDRGSSYDSSPAPESSFDGGGGDSSGGGASSDYDSGSSSDSGSSDSGGSSDF